MTGEARLLRKRQEVNYKPPVYRASSNNASSNAKPDVGIPPNHRDKVVTEDGRVFFPCPYCSRAFTDITNRAFHVASCPAKSYILTVANENALAKISTETGGKTDTGKQEDDPKGTLTRSRSFTEEEQKAFMQAVQLAKVSDTKKDTSRRVYKMRDRMKTQAIQPAGTVELQQKPNTPSKKTVTEKILDSSNEIPGDGASKKSKSSKSQKQAILKTQLDTKQPLADQTLSVILVEDNVTLHDEKKSNLAKKSTPKTIKPKTTSSSLLQHNTALNDSKTSKKSTPKTAKPNNTPDSKKTTVKDDTKSVVITPSLDITFLEQKITDLVNLISHDKKSNSPKICVRKDETSGSLIITTEPAVVKKAAVKRPSQGISEPAKKQKRNNDTLNSKVQSPQAKIASGADSSQLNLLNQSLQVKSSSKKKKTKPPEINSDLLNTSQDVAVSEENAKDEPVEVNVGNISIQGTSKTANKTNKNTKKVPKPKLNVTINSSVKKIEMKKQVKKVNKSSAATAKKLKVQAKNINKAKTKSPMRNSASSNVKSSEIMIKNNNVINSSNGNEDNDKIEEDTNKKAKGNNKNNLKGKVVNENKSKEAKKKASKISSIKSSGKITKPNVNRVRELKLKHLVDQVVRANIKRSQISKSLSIPADSVNASSEVKSMELPNIVSIDKTESNKVLLQQKQVREASNQSVQKTKTKQTSITKYTISCSENNVKSKEIEQDSKASPVHNNSKQNTVPNVFAEPDISKLQNKDEKSLIDSQQYLETKDNKSVDLKSPQIKDSYKLIHPNTSNKVGIYDVKANEKVVNLTKNDLKTGSVQMRKSNLIHKPLTDEELLSLLALRNDVQVDCIIQTSVKHESKPIIRSKSFNSIQLETLRAKTNPQLNSSKDKKQWTSTEGIDKMTSSNSKNDEKALFRELLLNNIPKDDMHPKKLEKYLKELASELTQPPTSETVVKKVQYTQQTSINPHRSANIPSIDISTLKKSPISSPNSSNLSINRSITVETKKSNIAIETDMNVSQEDLEREFNESDDKFEEKEDDGESDEMDSLCLEEEDVKLAVESHSASASSVPKSTSSTTCRYCHEKFEKAADMIRHRRLIHQLPKILVTQQQLDEHMQTDDYTQCPICKKVMRPRDRPSQIKWDFIKHLKTHSEIRNYPCTKCDKKFKRSDSLKEHERKHV